MLNKILGIKYPIILAPMFLITNEQMVKIALDNGITGAIPALNYRKDSDLINAIKNIKNHSSKPFGINLIANKSNPKYKQHLKILLDNKVDFIISSLGNPKELINEAKKQNIKVFCDVVDVNYAKKVEDLGADAIIAVNKSAGGHLGKYSADKLLSQIKTECSIPIIAAGGISTPEKLKTALQSGYAGASIGTVFIATHESPVSDEYKNAIVNYSADDIVLTSRLSGTPTTVINTEYVKQIGTQQNILEKLINRNTKLKQLAKRVTMKKGMNRLRKAAFGTTYKNVWCAGPSIDDVDKVQNLDETIRFFTSKLLD